MVCIRQTVLAALQFVIHRGIMNSQLLGYLLLRCTVTPQLFDPFPVTESQIPMHSLHPIASFLNKNEGAKDFRPVAPNYKLCTYQIGVVKAELEAKGITCKEYAFTDSNDVASMAQQATECDVLYIPTDNTAAAYSETIANVVVPAKVPVIAGEEGICRGCGAATLTISYYDLGYKTGEMAYEILVNGADVSTMPIAFAPQFTKKYNAAICEALGITVPDDYIPMD